MHLDLDLAIRSKALKNSGLSFLEGNGGELYFMLRPLTRCSHNIGVIMK
jgi:hypothetical protein